MSALYLSCLGQYTAVADDPETLRVRKNMETISNVAYHGDIARRQEMENTRPGQYEGEWLSTRQGCRLDQVNQI